LKEVVPPAQLGIGENDRPKVRAIDMMQQVESVAIPPGPMMRNWFIG
jgi:hypothetical protein